MGDFNCVLADWERKSNSAASSSFQNWVRVRLLGFFSGATHGAIETTSRQGGPLDLTERHVVMDGGACSPKPQ